MSTASRGDVRGLITHVPPTSSPTSPGDDSAADVRDHPPRTSEARRALRAGEVFTAEELEGFRQRMAAWSDANPWKAILAERLARLGGPHRPSTVADDPRTLREEPAVEMARETAELRGTESSPF